MPGSTNGNTGGDGALDPTNGVPMEVDPMTVDPIDGGGRAPPNGVGTVGEHLADDYVEVDMWDGMVKLDLPRTFYQLSHLSDAADNQEVWREEHTGINCCIDLMDQIDEENLTFPNGEPYTEDDMHVSACLAHLGEIVGHDYFGDEQNPGTLTTLDYAHRCFSRLGKTNAEMSEFPTLSMTAIHKPEPTDGVYRLRRDVYDKVDFYIIAMGLIRYDPPAESLGTPTDMVITVTAPHRPGHYTMDEDLQYRTALGSRVVAIRQRILETLDIVDEHLLAHA